MWELEMWQVIVGLLVAMIVGFIFGYYAGYDAGHFTAVWELSPGPK